jgi:GNAT superfamily N-acetyltransferase
MLIRKAAKEEFPTLSKLFVDNVNDTYITASEEEWGRTINGKWKPNLYEIVLQEMIDRQDNVLILVLIHEEKIVGYTFSSLETIPHLEDLMLDRSYRGKGFGKLLIAETINYLKSLGYTQFRAEIGKNNGIPQQLVKEYKEINVVIH